MRKVEILERIYTMRELLAKGAHSSYHWALDKRGEWTHPCGSRAVSFSLRGAYIRVADIPSCLSDEPWDRLFAKKWNDTTFARKEDVFAFLRWMEKQVELTNWDNDHLRSAT